MSKLLRDLLAAREPLFSATLQQLERSSGHPSADVRLSAEVVGKIQLQCKALGLDPHDTTTQEMYQSLMGVIAKHDAFLSKRIGVDQSHDVEQTLQAVVRLVGKLHIPKTAWALKASVAKKLLVSRPPKRTMKQLGYRSFDSMVKREPVAHIYAAMRVVESRDWQKAFNQQYRKLSPADFEMRPIEVAFLQDSRWQSISHTYTGTERHNIMHVNELGAVLLLPLPVEKLPGIAITVLPLVLHYINEIRMHSAYFKLLQVRADFGQQLAAAYAHSLTGQVVLAGQNVHWRVIQKHFGSRDAGFHPEVFEPYVNADDLDFARVEETLYFLEPALHFWFDMDYVGAADQHGVVSCNLIDNAVNYVNKFRFENRMLTNLRESLWNEIYARYLSEDVIETQLLSALAQELANGMPLPDKVSAS